MIGILGLDNFSVYFVSWIIYWIFGIVYNIVYSVMGVFEYRVE